MPQVQVGKLLYMYIRVTWRIVGSCPGVQALGAWYNHGRSIILQQGLGFLWLRWVPTPVNSQSLFSCDRYTVQCWEVGLSLDRKRMFTITRWPLTRGDWLPKSLWPEEIDFQAPGPNGEHWRTNGSNWKFVLQYWQFDLLGNCHSHSSF